MIILPEEEEQLPKLASPPPVHPVNRRPATPTPSLPDYETSQQQEQKQVDVLKKPSRFDFLSLLSRRWRIAFWGLIAYFVVTIAIGVPIIVMKSRPSAQYNKNPSMLYPSPAAWGSKNGSGIYGFNLGQFPVDVDDATSCDNWDYKDRWDNGAFKARLQYNIPVDNTVWIQSNASSLPITQTSPVTGSLSVGISQDPTDTEATVKIVMSYNDEDVRYRTSVCVMNLLGSDGVYLSVPSNLKGPDHLDFKITVTLPQPTSSKKPRHISNFLTYLPYFAQYISPVSPRLTFGSVALGGWKSNVTIDYMQAEAMLVKTPYANFNGMLNITNDDDADDYS